MKQTKSPREIVLARRDEFEELVAGLGSPRDTHGDLGSWKLGERADTTPSWTQGWDKGWSNWGK